MANLQKDWLSEVLFAQKISSILEEEKVKWDLQRGGVKASLDLHESPLIHYLNLTQFRSLFYVTTRMC